MNRQRYVVGFYFSSDASQVLLIEKLSPAWQRGKLNGVGGKVEPQDTAKAFDTLALRSTVFAMCREFKEEVGIDTDPGTWRECLTVEGEDWEMSVFAGFGDLDAAQHIEAERPVVVPVSALPDNVIPNLHWLIPMVLDNAVVGGRILY